MISSSYRGAESWFEYPNNDFTPLWRLAETIKLYDSKTYSYYKLSDLIQIFELRLREGRRFEALSGLFHLRSMILDAIQTTYRKYLDGRDGLEAQRNFIEPLLLRSGVDPLGYAPLDKYVVTSLVQYINDAFDFAIRFSQVPLSHLLGNLLNIEGSKFNLARMIGFSDMKRVDYTLDELIKAIESRGDPEAFIGGPEMLLAAGVKTVLYSYISEHARFIVKNESLWYQGYRTTYWNTTETFTRRIPPMSQKRYVPFDVQDTVEQWPGYVSSLSFPLTNQLMEGLRTAFYYSKVDVTGNVFFGPGIVDKTFESMNGMIKAEINAFKQKMAIVYRQSLDSDGYFLIDKFWRELSGTPFYGFVPALGAPIKYYKGLFDNRERRWEGPANEYGRYAQLVSFANQRITRVSGEKDTYGYLFELSNFITGARVDYTGDSFDFSQALAIAAGVFSPFAGIIVSLFFDYLRPLETPKYVWSREMGGMTFRRFGSVSMYRSVLGVKMYLGVTDTINPEEFLDPVAIYNHGNSNNKFGDFLPVIGKGRIVEEISEIENIAFSHANAIYRVKASSASIL